MQDVLTQRDSLTERQFGRITQMVRRLCGINLHNGKRELVHARLNKRLRQLRLDGFGDYLDMLSGPDGQAETVTMLDLLSTNVTQFMREPSHFAFLREGVLPGLMVAPGRGRGPRAIRVWSAGCSSGEEPYTLAMLLADTLGEPQLSAARILATDLSTRALARAATARYPAAAVSALPPAWRSRYLLACPPVAGEARSVQIAAPVRRMVSFARLNLLDPWPMKGPFDVIFCRNVMIYFDKPLQTELVGRFGQLLAPGGYLMLGHSESLAGVKHRLAYVQPTIYLKPEQGWE